MLLICISLIMLSIFSCAYWPFVETSRSSAQFLIIFVVVVVVAVVIEL